MPSKTTIERRLILVSGVVQGVGFRPFIFNLAQRHLLSGFVRNESGCVHIEIEGSTDALDAFLTALTTSPPLLSKILRIESHSMAPKNDKEFKIEKSAANDLISRFVAADAATCKDCLQELFNSSDRRFRYPFINCTNCGPRFTIIQKLPYDRTSTTMSNFAMCQDCKTEYDDPTNRRFHAQPNACSNCGPELSLLDKSACRMNDSESALQGTVQFLRTGSIVALKGLGGYHLICAANNDCAIKELRRRKRRNSKPFALMFGSIDKIKEHCELSTGEAELLQSAASPIVLLKRKPESCLPLSIAPDTKYLGVMLPYTPLHHLLLSDFDGPLIATSGNKNEEPISRTNSDAHKNLSSIADYFLEHNRDIQSRYDDSVVQIVGGGLSTFRRSRGYAPLPLELPYNSKKSVLAFGTQLKNTFCIIEDGKAFVSQHIGDQENLESNEYFQDALESYLTLFAVKPELVACDMHPDYRTTELAKRYAHIQEIPCYPVQHHHAHIVACAIEHGLTEAVIGVAFDGLGYGNDQTLWGGEFIYCQLDRFVRLAHLQPMLMPGGSLAIRHPWRMALGFVESHSEKKGLFDSFLTSLRRQHGDAAINLICKQIESGLNCPTTTSCGRLFDILASLLGICQTIEYEGQAAILLESTAARSLTGNLKQDLSEHYLQDCPTLDTASIETSYILIQAFDDFSRGLLIDDIAKKFHATLAHLIARTCSHFSEKFDADRICLSGGVFQNTILRTMTDFLLNEKCLNAYFPSAFPMNDGGVSLGQAVVALAQHDVIQTK